MTNLAHSFASGVADACLTLEVRSYQGVAPLEARVQTLGAEGGTIGRGPENALVLPDALKTVSRVHAQIDFSEGAWWLSDLGTNPSRLNGRLVKPDVPCRLEQGDRVEIGAYVLDVSICHALDQASWGDGHAQPLVSLLPFEAAAVDLAVEPPFVARRPGETPVFEDPLIHADVLIGTPVTGTSFDPLGAPQGRDTSGERTSHAYGGSESDHVSPEQFSFAAPLPLPLPLPLREQAQGVTLVRDELCIPEDYDPLSDAAPPVDLAQGEALVKVMPPNMRKPDAITRSPAARQPDPTRTPNRDGSISPATSHTDSSLAALLDGLGLDATAVHGRDGAEFAALAGRMLRAAVRGTVGVLMSRSVLKREVRLDTTLLLQRDNNPLKFFPDGDSALQQMLSGQGTGYLPAEAALQGAFDDIRCHELAVLAGMRAALQHLLMQCDPRLDSAAAKRGWFDGWPLRRKARQWDRFTARFEALSRASADDLQALCGNAFNEAYERQASLLRNHQAQPHDSIQRDDHVLE